MRQDQQGGEGAGETLMHVVELLGAAVAELRIIAFSGQVAASPERRGMKKGPISFDLLPDVLTPQDLWEFLPLGRDAVYEALRTGKIRGIRRGQKWLISKEAVGDFLRRGVK